MHNEYRIHSTEIPQIRASAERILGHWMSIPGNDIIASFDQHYIREVVSGAFSLAEQLNYEEADSYCILTSEEAERSKRFAKAMAEKLKSKNRPK